MSLSRSESHTPVLLTDMEEGSLCSIGSETKSDSWKQTDNMPAHLCFDAKHALWTFGWERDKVRNSTADSQDYFLFRKYSVDGKQLGAYALRSLFPRLGLEPGSSSGGLWSLRISDDRIGAIAYSGRTSEIPEWIEVGLDGGLIGHWKLGPYHDGGMAFASRNGLCRQIGLGGRIDCFDRVAQAWKTLASTSSNDENGRPLGILLGADGEYWFSEKSTAAFA